ncbi:MAG: ADP-ribosylglycohydrolase family protein [Rhodocyclaceae bacterium]|nr:ADP-ribosylglycohydrolase family protein [Rhodocyclaceae bacterium]
MIGDIVGSVYEFNNYRAKDFNPFFHPKSSYTDDSICTIAVADALVSNKSPALALKDWGERYWHNGGWGRSFALWLGSDSMDPYNSYGNGAGMRVSSAAFLATSFDEAMHFSDKVTEVTHNHPEGMKGARATTQAIWMTLRGEAPEDIRHQISATYAYDLNRTIDEIRPTYRFNESCQRTVPEAIICALQAENYIDAIRSAISIGGDSDTLAAICGPIAEARFGIPEEIVIEGLSKLPQDILQVLLATYLKAMERQSRLQNTSPVWMDSAQRIIKCLGDPCGIIKGSKPVNQPLDDGYPF